MQRLFFLFMVFKMTSVVVMGQEVPAEHFNVNRENVLVDGYDVVSYFIGTVSKGKPSISTNNNGINYWFSSEENKKIFLKNPEKFVPAYGGWCAYAMGDSGEKVKIDPKTYKIFDGKLFLFYNFYFKNTLIDWNEDESGLRKKADANWAKLVMQ